VAPAAQKQRTSAGSPVLAARDDGKRDVHGGAVRLRVRHTGRTAAPAAPRVCLLAPPRAGRLPPVERVKRCQLIESAVYRRFLNRRINKSRAGREQGPRLRQGRSCLWVIEPRTRHPVRQVTEGPCGPPVTWRR